MQCRHPRNSMVNEMAKVNDTTQSYATVLKNWQVKAYGPKPTVEMLATVHALGLRKGKQALLTAMRLREGGATTAQMTAAGSANFDTCGPANNIITQNLIPAKLVTQTKNKNSFGHTVYTVKLTAKGQAKVDAALGKAKAKPAAKPAAEPVPAETPITPQA